MERNCEVCGRIFKTVPSRVKDGYGRFCSRECWAKSQRDKIKRTCQFCGKEFEAKPSNVKRGLAKFCSVECYNQSRMTGEVRHCLACRKKFYVTKHDIDSDNKGKYCSWSCFRKVQDSKPNFIEVKCEHCHRHVYKWRKDIKRTERQFCSLACKAKYYSGDRAPSWEGGISFEPYAVQFNARLKREIRQRDKYICQICGRVQDGKKLSVHHIDYDKQNNDTSNLISLCSRCHSKTVHNREYWQSNLIESQFGVK